ncbi:MAG: HNH endonuclease [Leptolyngbya sp. SIO1D8]|nr:HNH endonuclease [Leptolyngbya sp. SIO1D8]
MIPQQQTKCPNCGQSLFNEEGIHIHHKTPRCLEGNRVAGGFSPPAPTAPRMRVRMGRFLEAG